MSCLIINTATAGCRIAIINARGHACNPGCYLDARVLHKCVRRGSSKQPLEENETLVEATTQFAHDVLNFGQGMLQGTEWVDTDATV